MTQPKFLNLLFLICLLFTSANADVPPDAGYVPQTASLTLETKDDFSDYRFFMESPIRIEEITITRGEATVIDGANRGGAARVGTLWAIPRTTIGDDFGVSAPEKLQGMRDALKEGRMYHAVKLLSHGFQTTIREEEKAGWKDPVYRIEKSAEKGLVAVLLSGGKTERNAGLQTYSNEPKTSMFWATVVGASLLTFSLICLGVWAVRRSKMRTVESGSPTK